MARRQARPLTLEMAAGHSPLSHRSGPALHLWMKGSHAPLRRHSHPRPGLAARPPDGTAGRLARACRLHERACRRGLRQARRAARGAGCAADRARPLRKTTSAPASRPIRGTGWACSRSRASRPGPCGSALYRSSPAFRPAPAFAIFVGSPIVLFSATASRASRVATAGLIVIALAHFQRRHLVFAARLEPRLDLAQPLAAPEAEQHAALLGADQQHRAVGEVDQMPPFDPLFERLLLTTAARSISTQSRRQPVSAGRRRRDRRRARSFA